MIVINLLKKTNQHMIAGNTLTDENERNTIIFTLVYRGEEFQVQTSRNQYRTLMTLISDYLAITGFGLCCGMGSCGTCMVEICEKNTIIKRSTLSCNVQVTDELANVTIYIVANVY